MSRTLPPTRFLVVLLPLALLAGCTAGPLAGTPSATVSETVDASYPDRPAKLTNATVARFARQYEQALVYERRRGPAVERIQFVPVVDVRPIGDGFSVEIRYTLGIVENTSNGKVISDLRFVAAYWITDTVVRRTRVHGIDEPPDPRTNGTVHTAHGTPDS